MDKNFVPCHSRNVYKKTKVDKWKLIHKGSTNETRRAALSTCQIILGVSQGSWWPLGQIE